MSRIMRYQLGWIGVSTDPARTFTRYVDGKPIERWRRFGRWLWVRLK